MNGSYDEYPWWVALTVVATLLTLVVLMIVSDGSERDALTAAARKDYPEPCAVTLEGKPAQEDVQLVSACGEYALYKKTVWREGEEEAWRRIGSVRMRPLRALTGNAEPTGTRPVVARCRRENVPPNRTEASAVPCQQCRDAMQGSLPYEEMKEFDDLLKLGFDQLDYEHRASEPRPTR